MSQQKAFVTGAAGFIGSNLVDFLLKHGWQVTGFDNFSTGCRPFLQEALAHPNFRLVEGDLLNTQQLNKAMVEAAPTRVYHLAANADVRFGLNHPDRDLQQNTIATFNVLEAMRLSNTGVKEIVFSSTGSIYGESNVIPTPEDAPFPIQTSLYGASKLAGEGLISAYAEGFNFQAWIFRFVSILGPRYTHGHIFDFYKKLLQNPKQLEVLGNGLQRKSYLHVEDCLEAIHTATSTSGPKVQIFNLGTNEFCQVQDSVGWICKELGLQPKICPTGGERGWVGDNPFIFLETQKIRALSWRPRHTIEESVVLTLRWLKENHWCLNRN